MGSQREAWGGGRKVGKAVPNWISYFITEQTTDAGVQVQVHVTKDSTTCISERERGFYWNSQFCKEIIQIPHRHQHIFSIIFSFSQERHHVHVHLILLKTGAVS